MNVLGTAYFPDFLRFEVNLGIELCWEMVMKDESTALEEANRQCHNSRVELDCNLTFLQYNAD